jgi:hypothetical protein
MPAEQRSRRNTGDVHGWSAAECDAVVESILPRG